MTPLAELKLKPCPFCGGEPTLTDCDDGKAWVQCYECFTEGPLYASTDESIAAWNRRSGEDEESSAREALPND